MNVDEYKASVRSLLMSPAATDEMWDQAMDCVLVGSEDSDMVPAIDAVIRPDGERNE